MLRELAAALDGEQGKMLGHLLVCSSCRDRLIPLLQDKPHASPRARGEILEWRAREEDYTRAIVGDLQAQERRISSIERERAEAKGLLDQLITLPPERRTLVLENSARFHTWSFLELLIDKGLKARAGASESGEMLGNLALRLADRLDVEVYGAERIADLRARAWGSIANDRRIAFDLRRAETAMAKAFLLLREGTGDLIERAILLDLKASLLRALRRFDTAIRLLDRAHSIFVAYGDLHRAGRVLVNKALVHTYAGRPEKSIFLLYRAIELIDADEEPYVVFSIWHNLSLGLAEMGRFSEARELSRRAAPIYQRFRGVVPQSLRKWVEGKIAFGLGDAAEAESQFLHTRDAFADIGMPYNAVLVSLDLALLYASQKRIAELRSLAEEIFCIFASRGIQREALAAFVCLRQAAAVG